MTREEALQILDTIPTIGEQVDALEMAIQALEQEPCDDAEQIDYHDDFETASRKIHDYEERQKQNDKKCGSYNNTNTFKSCCDCKLIGTDICYMVCGGSKSLYKPKQKSKPCTDAVSREDAIKALQKVACYSAAIRARMIGAIEDLPPVTHKSGKWIDYRDDGFVECPFCGHATNCEDDIDELHYCFYCGARMVEPQESKEPVNETVSYYTFEEHIRNTIGYGVMTEIKAKSEDKE